MGGKGTLTLIAKNRKHVAIGRRINNHLYKMNFTMRNASESKGTTPDRGKATPDMEVASPEAFQTSETTPGWETWHRRFGHISYSGLKRLLDKGMVTGFNVDTTTPKPDCVACTEAKMT